MATAALAGELLSLTGIKLVSYPDCHIETGLAAGGFGTVAGVDETGRGPLAGPVFAAAVILDRNNIPPGLDDSKRLTAPRRRMLDRTIRATALVSVAAASVSEIEELNILHATMLAMRRAVEGLDRKPAFVLVDGNRIPEGLPCPGRSVVGGDRTSVSIAAASIVAKVERDRCMQELDLLHPEYGWARNCGYGTSHHVAALRRLGPTPHHRRGFMPLRAMLEQSPAAATDRAAP